MSVDGVDNSTDTLLSTLDPDRVVQVRGRDTYRLFGYVADLCGLQGWEIAIDPDDSLIRARRPSGEELGTIQILHGYDAGPRWMNLLLPSELERGVGSELWLDHGCSGLGRYMLRKHIRGGQFHALSRLRVNRSGYFGDVARLVFEQKHAAIQGLLPMPTNYVVDTEFISRRDAEGNLDRYVYAVGLAKFCNGEYKGSTTIVDDSPEIEGFMRANDAAILKERPNYERLRQTGLPGDPSEVISRLSACSQSPHVRVYAKGNTAEAELLASEVVGATKLFRRRRGVRGPVREMGHLVDRYEPMARRASWPSLHNPGPECVLFGIAIGLGSTLPALRDVGMDPLRLLLSEPGPQLV